MARASWSGMIKFSLMSIPVKQYSAVSEGSTRLANLHRDCGTRLRSGLWALGRVVRRNREVLVLIRPFKKGLLLLQSLRYPSELKEVGEIKHDFQEVGERELNLAAELMKQMKGDFDLSKYKDRYEEGLRELIERKLSGEKVEVVKAEAKAEEESIVDQLLKSLELARR